MLLIGKASDFHGHIRRIMLIPWVQIPNPVVVYGSIGQQNSWQSLINCFSLSASLKTISQLHLTLEPGCKLHPLSVNVEDKIYITFNRPNC